MMLTRLRVRNFQSLHEADVELGKLTVIVGPSNSGKSALLRAARTLVYNANSPAFVTTGKKSSFIELSDGDIKVSLERGKSLSTYHLLDGKEQIYAKSGKEVPPDIEAKLKMKELEGQPINFAFQFDKPFLLDEPSTVVAKVLGDLSNINVIYDAVREANRRRLEAAAKLRVRRADAESLQEKAQDFTDLPKKKELLEKAREQLDDSLATQRIVSTLKSTIVEAESAAAAVALLEESPEIPSIDIPTLEKETARVRELRTLLDEVDSQLSLRQQAKGDVDSLTDQTQQLNEAYTQALRAAGTCPTCGQLVS